MIRSNCYLRPSLIHLKLACEQYLTGDAVLCATYCTLVQESIIELPKLLLGLFGTEVPEEVSMEVSQLREERQTGDQ